MISAYRNLRKHSHQSRWNCVKYQIWIWWFNLKHFPGEWRHRRFMKMWAKKDPDGMKRSLEDIRKRLLGD